MPNRRSGHPKPVKNSRIHQYTLSVVRRSIRLFNRGAKQSGALLAENTRSMAPLLNTAAQEEEGMDRNLCANDEQSLFNSIEECPEATFKLAGKSGEKTKELGQMSLDVLQQKLKAYRSPRDFLIAIKNAVVAHDKSFAAGAKHHDISVRSILLTVGDKGALVDFDSTSGNDSKHARSMEFMSARQQLNLSDSDTHEPPSRADDLESFFLVLVQVAMSCLPHKASGSLVEEYHKHVFLGDDGLYKKTFVRDGTLLKLGFEKGPFFDLLRCLSLMFAARYAYPPSEGDSEEAIQTWKHNQTLKQRLESDSSQWMVNLFSKYISDPRWTTPNVPAQSTQVEKAGLSDATTTEKRDRKGAVSKRNPKRGADDIVVDEEERPSLKPVSTFRIIRPSPEYIEGHKQAETSIPAKRKREDEPAVAKKSRRTLTRARPTPKAKP